MFDFVGFKYENWRFSLFLSLLFLELELGRAFISIGWVQGVAKDTYMYLFLVVNWDREEQKGLWVLFEMGR
jgi:hypothetical protein